MTTITEKLADIARALVEWESAPERYAGDLADLAQQARTTLAEYEATPRAYFPADYIREKLERYDAEIADGTVSYPFYAGCFSQVARGMMELAS